MKYIEAIQIIELVNANEGSLSLNPADESYEWPEALVCVRRHEQRRLRRGEEASDPSLDVPLQVTSDLPARSGLAAWEAGPLTTIVGPLVEALVAGAEGGAR